MAEDLRWTTMKQYSSDKANELAAFASILSDLRFARRACELLLAQFPPVSGHEEELSETAILRKSLWNSALIAYARSFASGVRTACLSTDMFNALGDKSVDAVKAHEHFLAQRNKHIAHSVNRLEDVRVLLMVRDGVNTTKGVHGAGPFHIWQDHEEPGNVQTLANLAMVLAQQIEALIPVRIEEVLAEARVLNDNQLASLPDMAIQLPVDVSEVGKRRPE
jgi:hypothetical protein